ncbi:hypothetical protein [Rufibacter sp. LB8]|uniref:hypothetical protein n=1 Tax=Rufibacter sp. LB8 TaxID=2777781 RepID=UPI00178C2BC2|nr:hypothetical protein [Rufibacter sp. LB8]
MGETIFLLSENGKLVELNEANYISEDLLQSLLANYPSLISGSQINKENPRRWLLVSREFGVPDDANAGNRWSLDHLFIDQDGIPTLVEVKRSTDSRIRREVIGQILDYAANAVTYWSIEEIQHRFELQCKAKGSDQELILGDFLQGEMEPEQFWELTKTNLRAGKVRMLIIADKIPKELQRIIEFLNEQMQTAEILGLEIKQFIGQDNLKTLVPRVIGQTTVAEDLKSISKGRAEQWTQETFFAELTKLCGTHEASIAKRLLEFVEPKVTRIRYGRGHQLGSYQPVYHRNGHDYRLFGIWTSGYIETYFQYYKDQPAFKEESKRLEFLERLNQIEGVNISRDKIALRPSFKLNLLADESQLQKFMQVVDWLLEEIKK